MPVAIAVAGQVVAAHVVRVAAGVVVVGAVIADAWQGGVDVRMASLPPSSADTTGFCLLDIIRV